MSMFIAGAVYVGTTALSMSVQRNAAKNAKKDAKKDALAAENQARRAETFAETEGSGIGNLGKISLEVDSEIDEDEELTSTNLRI